VKPIRLLLLVLVLGAALVAMPGSASAKTTACGSFTAKNGNFTVKVHVYRIKGHVSCRTARRLSHHVIGARCQGEKVVGSYRCYHGAPALREPASSGYTLKKRGSVIEGRLR
jgi:hypothetical protein